MLNPPAYHPAFHAAWRYITSDCFPSNVCRHYAMAFLDMVVCCIFQRANIAQTKAQSHRLLRNKPDERDGIAAASPAWLSSTTRTRARSSSSTACRTNLLRRDNGNHTDCTPPWADRADVKNIAQLFTRRCAALSRTRQLKYIYIYLAFLHPGTACCSRVHYDTQHYHVT